MALLLGTHTTGRLRDAGEDILGTKGGIDRRSIRGDNGKGDEGSGGEPHVELQEAKSPKTT